MVTQGSLHLFVYLFIFFWLKHAAAIVLQTQQRWREIADALLCLNYSWRGSTGASRNRWETRGQLQYCRPLIGATNSELVPPTYVTRDGPRMQDGRRSLSTWLMGQ